MAFHDQGFLSESLNSWARKNHPEANCWFNLADEINGLAMRAIFQATPSQSSHIELLTSVLFGRALQSFEAAILLADRGMLTDAQTLVRNCVESTIALGGVSKIDGFIDTLIEDHYKHRKALANCLLEDKESLTTLSLEQITALKNLLDEIKTKYPDQEVRRINWEEIARKSGLAALYNIIYRETSGNSAHVTIDSLNWHIQADSEGNIEALNFGPKAEELIPTISKAINAFLVAGFFVINTYKLSDIESSWRDCFNRWEKMLEAI